MEFCISNLINTTTQLTINNNTATVGNIFNPELFQQYYSDGLNDDTTVASMTITFDATTNISRIAIMEHNLKDYKFFYNGATANAIAFTSGATTTSNFSSNSETAQYFRFSTLAVSSITIDMRKTMVANSEKAVGYLLLSDLKLDFERDPSAKNYKPSVDPKDVTHTLSDGGTRIHFIRSKYKANISFEYISTSFRNSLKTIYDTHDSFVFVPFGTTTSWDKVLFDTVWAGNFDFFEYSDNSAVAGFSGKINLMETPV